MRHPRIKTQRRSDVDERSSGSTTVEAISTFDAVRAELDALAVAGRNVFATWEWLTTWWRHFGDGDLALVGSRGTDGNVIAVIPIYRRKRGPITLARFVGHGAGIQLGPICAPADRPVAALALRRALDRLEWDVFLGEFLHAGEGWTALLDAQPARHDPSPILRLDVRDWDDYLASRSSNFRQELRRKERRLARDHGLRYRLADDAEALDTDLDILFSLHAERWSDESEFAAFDRERFHREFARLALDRGWMRLWFMELEGVPVAAWYGFRFADVETYYQAGRDRAWDDASVGLLLVAHSIREALQDGMREYRLGPGGTGYKYRFTDEDPGLDTIAFGRTALGKAAVTGASALRRWAPLRAMLRRFAG